MGNKGGKTLSWLINSVVCRFVYGCPLAVLQWGRCLCILTETLRSEMRNTVKNSSALSLEIIFNMLSNYFHPKFNYLILFSANIGTIHRPDLTDPLQQKLNLQLCMYFNH